MQSLLFLPLAIANALTARLNDGYVVMGSIVQSAKMECYIIDTNNKIL